MNKIVRQAAALCAAALAVAGTCALPAADARVISGNDAGLAAEDVDKQQPITLTVRKAATNPYDDVPDGEKPAAIAGAVFTLSRVSGVDVTTAQGRERAKGFTLDDAASTGLTDTVQRTTDASGEARFTDLTAGLYLLEESAPGGDLNYQLSSPKLVILPLGNVSGEGFEYENVVVTKAEPNTPPPGQNSETSTPATPTRTPSTSTSTAPKRPPLLPVPLPLGPHTENTTAPGTPSQPAATGSGGTAEGGGAAGGAASSAPGAPEMNPPQGGARTGGLASTGASVLWLLGVGAVLALLGSVLARRKRDRLN